MRGFFYKDRKTLYMILSIVLLSVFSLTIVYAALNTVLNITGNAEVVASNWDIHLDNVQLASGSVTSTAPTITNKTTASFQTTLTNPGDFYEFTIDVVNSGTIDAVIDSIEKTALTEPQSKYLNYIVEYQNGQSISTKQLVEKNSYVRLKVKVEYRKDLTASDLPKTTETLTLSFTVKYVQSDDSSNNTTVENNGNLIRVISGTGTKTSDEVCIGNECFYVISSDDNTVTMLAKYNLYVGGEYYNTKWTAYGDEATGKQDSTMLGYVKGNSTSKGGTHFSNASYWYNGGLKTEYGVGYPTYVYDSNSTLYTYVENYKLYLSALGVIPIEARLITLEELEGLGCSSSKYSCSGAPSWVYVTSYWSGTALSSDRVWYVYSHGPLSYEYNYSYSNSFGCRPVIVIDKKQIIGNKKIIEFEIEERTYQAEEGMTWGEWSESLYDVDDEY